MARPPKRPSGSVGGPSARVTPKGGSPSRGGGPSSARRTNKVALVLIVLILVGLVAGTVGIALSGGTTTVETVPTPGAP